MKKTLVTLGIGASSVLLVSAALADNMINTELTLDASDLQAFHTDTGAGDISIQGDSKATDITVKATIRGRDLDEDDYTLYLERRGSKAVLKAEVHGSFIYPTYIDLDVTMPSGLALEAEDSSGEMFIRDLQAGLRIDDSSGDVEVKNVVGKVTVTDSSGDLTLITINGDVDIEDRSGDIKLITTNGNVRIDDRSGDIDIRTVTGNVDIEDKSGDIDVSGVEGSVTAEDSSGDIYINDAESFELLSDGSGDVELVRVGKDRK